MPKYKATAYIRLSYTDDHSSESDSVSNQRKLIENFVEHNPDIEVVSEKIDDGYSGIIFDRPAFKEMMQDVTDGNINCVIVKDLSRLGREYIETGRYLRRVFPAYGVRFIAITDNERRLEQVLEFKARLYESLVGGMLTKEEYASYKAKYTKQAEDIRESVRVLKEKLTEVLENRSERNRWISQFTQFSTLETLDRRALIHMVQSIRVRGKKELDITFTHEDEYKKALQLLALAAQQKDYEQRKVG